MRFSPNQNEFICKATHRYNLKIGAVRSGKSYVDIAYTIPARLRAVKDKDGLNFIIGVSKETIERNVLQPMREIYTDAIVGTINSRNIAVVCGVPVYCIGAEKKSQLAKLQGSSIKYCYGDEIAKWNSEVFAMLQSRLDKPYSKFDGACNPEYPGHWLKEFIDRQDIDSYVQKYTIFDNPFLSQKFVEDLCKEYAGTVYYKRYIEGEWSLAEGLIYPMYMEAYGEPPENRKPDEYCMSIDYGTMNAFAALLFAKYGETWYAVDEYYYSGRETGEQKTDEEYAANLDKWLEKYGFEQPLYTIIDPSAASFIALLNKRQHRYRAHKADNDVLDGIRETATALKKGYVKVTEKCKAWRKEVQGYVWDDACIEDRPIKANDHCITGDTLIMTVNGEKYISDLVGTSGYVWSYNIYSQKSELKPYHNCRMTQEEADIYEIETEDGRIIHCTGEHPILTQRGYVQTKELTVSDKIIDISDSVRYNVNKNGGLHSDGSIL